MMIGSVHVPKLDVLLTQWAYTVIKFTDFNPLFKHSNTGPMAKFQGIPVLLVQQSPVAFCILVCRTRSDVIHKHKLKTSDNM